MVTQWFKYMFCKGKTVLLNAIQKSSERENYIDGFQRASRPDWEREDKLKYDVTFLIGTVGILGTGVTLNTAERLVLDCCLYVRRDENQAYARIDRMGNRNSRVITYRLVTNARVDLKILERQAIRQAIIQAAGDTTLLEWLKALAEQERREKEEAEKGI
jgi:SNF2 family DNA or RNA helicase